MNKETEAGRGAVAGRVERPVRPLVGCDDLREWLTSQGFRIAPDGLARDDNRNCCNWYAYRPTKRQARECECNDGKPVQIVVRPWRIEHANAPSGAWESAEVDVTGEAGSHWYKLQCYSLKPGELMGRLHEIEAALIAAWNALRPNVSIQPLPQAVGCNTWLGPAWPQRAVKPY